MRAPPQISRPGHTCQEGKEEEECDPMYLAMSVWITLRLSMLPCHSFAQLLVTSSATSGPK